MFAKIFYIFLFFSPLIYLPFFTDPFELPKTLFLFAFISFSISFLTYKKRTLSYFINHVKQSMILKSFLLYLIIMVFCSIIGINFFNSLRGQYFRYQGIITQTAYLGFFLLAAKNHSFGIKKPLIYRALTYSAITVCILTLLQATAYFFLKIPIYTFYGRMTALSGNPNFAGGFLALGFIYTYLYFNKKRVTTIILAVAFFTAIVLTQSRGAFLLFISYIPILFLYGKVSVKKILFSYALIIIIAAFIFPKKPLSPFENRTLIWQKGLSAFLARPLTGWGLENFDSVFQSQLSDKPYDFNLKQIRVDKAHNETLEIAVASGILGLTAWFFIIFQGFKLLWERKNKPDGLQNLLVFSGFLFLSQLNVLNIPQYLLFYLTLGLADMKGKG